MSTTTILVENLIQGLQTFLWIALISASFVDRRLFDSHVVSDYPAAMSFVALALFYWLGIIVDTVYYHLFVQRHESRWARTLLDSETPTLSEMVFTCLTANGDLARLLMERQAHLRLLRVSVVNSVFITIALLLFMHVGVSRLTLPRFGLIAAIGAAVFLTVAYGWRKLYKYYLTIVKTAYLVLMERDRRRGAIATGTATA